MAPFTRAWTLGRQAALGCRIAGAGILPTLKARGWGRIVNVTSLVTVGIAMHSVWIVGCTLTRSM